MFIYSVNFGIFNFNIKLIWLGCNNEVFFYIICYIVLVLKIYMMSLILKLKYLNEFKVWFI